MKFFVDTFCINIYPLFFETGPIDHHGHPHRRQQAQPWGVQQVPFIFIKMNI